MLWSEVLPRKKRGKVQEIERKRANIKGRTEKGRMGLRKSSKVNYSTDKRLRGKRLKAPTVNFWLDRHCLDCLLDHFLIIVLFYKSFINLYIIRSLFSFDLFFKAHLAKKTSFSAMKLKLLWQKKCVIAPDTISSFLDISSHFSSEKLTFIER